MRKIEQQITDAIRARRGFCGGNTTVTLNVNSDGAGNRCNRHSHNRGDAMNARETIEDAASPEAFVAAIRRQVDKCYESANELRSAWQDKNAGAFWDVAARELERLADKLERATP